MESDQKVMRRQQVIPRQWKKFLPNSENKLDLIDFFWYDWPTNLEHCHQLDGKELHMTIGDEAPCISPVHGLITSLTKKLVRFYYYIHSGIK